MAGIGVCATALLSHPKLPLPAGLLTNEELATSEVYFNRPPRDSEVPNEWVVVSKRPLASFRNQARERPLVIGGQRSDYAFWANAVLKEAGAGLQVNSADVIRIYVREGEPEAWLFETVHGDILIYGR
jgi:hypothetical protein